MSAWPRWSFHLLALLSSTITFSTTVYPVFNWDYRFFFFFSKCILPWSATVLFLQLSCGLSLCPIVAPSKKGTSKLWCGPCARARREKAGINFCFMFSFSFVSLMFLSLCCSFFTCVVQWFSFSNVSHDRNEKCVFRARPQLKPAMQILPQPLNILEQGKIITHPSPTPTCSVPLVGKFRGGRGEEGWWHIKSSHGHGMTFG